MSEVTVRALGEEDWQEFRAIRLAALIPSAKDRGAIEIRPILQ